MSNIKQIEVNGEIFGIESVSDIYVSNEKPVEAPLPLIWIQPVQAMVTGETLAFEAKPGSSSYNGDYTLDEEGNLIEKSSSSSSTTPSATIMMDLFTNKQYKIGFNQNSNVTDYFVGVYFYDNENNFISKTTASKSGSVTVNETILEFELPENARKIRLAVSPNYYYYTTLAFADVQITGRSMGSAGSIYSTAIRTLDGDHYVRI